MVQIIGNLHRVDLTKLERAEQIAEWVRLTELKSYNLRRNQRPKQTRKDQGATSPASTPPSANSAMTGPRRCQ
jgi:hypothetical protein